MIQHQGYITGNIGYVALFPETTGAIVDLGNSNRWTDAMRLLGQILVEAVLGSEFNTDKYVSTAIAAAKNTIAVMDTIHKQLLNGGNLDQPTRDVTAYTGHYYNSVEIFFIDINETNWRIQVAYGSF